MARSEFRWHQNGNVFWADFRPNYRTRPPLPDPANTALPLVETPQPDRIRQLERRMDHMLLDVLQGHERILRALGTYDAEAQRWKTLVACLSTEIAGRGAGYTRELAAIRESLEKAGIEVARDCGPSSSSVLKAIGGALVSLHLAAGALPARDVIKHALGDDYNITTTEVMALEHFTA